MMYMEKETLWIISELFPPEETSTGYIMGEIANAMTQKYNVKAICGPKIYDAHKKVDYTKGLKLDSSIEVHRVNAVYEDINNKLSRVKKFLLMSWRIFKVAQKEIKKGDHVLLATNPFPLIVLMSFLRSRRKFFFSVLVHDVFPDSLFTDMHLPRIVYMIALYLFNKAYARTDQLLVLGRDMAEVMEKKCAKSKHTPIIRIVENWGDTKNINPSNSINENDKIVIQYAGNIGHAQGVEEFVDDLKASECENVIFSIWGVGNEEQSIKKKVEEYGLSDHVVFNGPYLRSQQNDVLNACDIALVRLTQGMYGLGTPSKTYNILAAGKPILYIGERGTEIWREVEENNIGVCFEPSAKESLHSFLHQLSFSDRDDLREKGLKARKVVEEKYTKEHIMNKFLIYI